MYGIIDAFNAHSDLFTTSSCAGRIQLICLQDIGQKKTVEFRKTWHRVIKLEELLAAIEMHDIPHGYILLLQAQSPILHVGCRTLEMANQLRTLAHSMGWKNSSIRNANEEKWMVEIIGTARLDTILMRQGVQPLPDEARLGFIVNESCFVLELGQSKLPDLHKLPTNLNPIEVN